MGGLISCASFPSYLYIVSHQIGIKKEPHISDGLLSTRNKPRSYAQNIENQSDGNYSWLLKGLPLILSGIWISINTWAIQPAIIPYAAKNASQSGDGSLLLQYIQQSKIFTSCLGAFITTFFQYHKYGKMMF